MKRSNSSSYLCKLILSNVVIGEVETPELRQQIMLELIEPLSLADSLSASIPNVAAQVKERATKFTYGHSTSSAHYYYADR